MKQTFSAFLEERDKAFMALDECYVARMVPNAPPEMRLVILHKARYECTSIPDAYRFESGQWLIDNDHTRLTGDPVLPEGELP